MIDVILSVINSEKYIMEAIKSVLDQTEKDFCLYIIDDHSSDKTVALIKSFDDKRIHLYLNNESKGLTANLNFLIEIGRGDYIARIDGDDVCVPNRFEKELEYLTSQNLDIVGSNVEIIDGQGAIKGEITYQGSNIYQDMFKRNLLIHSTVMMKRGIFDKLKSYEDKYPRNEDYDLWFRALQAKFKIGICPEKLIKFRIHDASISLENLKEQQLNSLKLRFSMIVSKTYSFFNVIYLIPQFISFLLPRRVNLLIHQKIYHSK
jgi:glycosyltransferase involved in cell wall biosynthesis